MTPDGYRPPVRPQRGGYRDDYDERRDRRDRDDYRERDDYADPRERRGDRGGRPPARRRTKRRRPGRIFGYFVLILVLLIVGFGIYVDTSLNRVSAFSDYSGRPASADGTNWLVVGSDSRAGLTDDEAAKLHTGTSSDAGGQRTDSMMLLHIPSNSAKPTLVSLMRDSYVSIPGHGKSKINAAYAYGGPQLLTETVEQNTGMHIDHYMEIGFGGFSSVVDDVGGVNMCVPKAVKDTYAGINLKAGCQDLDGPTALGYVRSRHGFDSGDYARTDHQREFLGALASKVSSAGTIFNPFRLVPLLSDLPGSLTVDEGDHVWNLVGMAWAIRGLSGGGVNTTIVPVSGNGPGSSLLWDKSKSQQLFNALNNDQEVPQSLLSNNSN